MPLTKRIIPCLDVDHGKVVKGINFIKLRRAGDPVELAKRYCEDGADELVFLDVTASSENRRILGDIVKNIALEINIPFTVGGGLRNIADVRKILCKGADKVSINTAAIEKPKIIRDLARIFGQQCIVIAIDVKRNFWGKYEVYSHDGKEKTKLDPIKWAIELENKGVGELLLTSMDCDGTWNGYDVELVKTISDAVSVPVIANGGAGSVEDIEDVVHKGGASAVGLGSMVVYQQKGLGVLVNFPDKNDLYDKLKI